MANGNCISSEALFCSDCHFICHCHLTDCNGTVQPEEAKRLVLQYLPVHAMVSEHLCLMDGSVLCPVLCVFVQLLACAWFQSISLMDGSGFVSFAVCPLLCVLCCVSLAV